MLKLSPNDIVLIEKLLADGHRVDVYVQPKQTLDSGYNQTVVKPEHIAIQGRPIDEGVLHFPSACLLSDSDPVVVDVVAHAPDGQVGILSIEVPAGVQLIGFLTGKG